MLDTGSLKKANIFIFSGVVLFRYSLLAQLG